MKDDLVYAESKKSTKPAAFDARFQYDSGWVAENNQTNHNLVLSHNLKASPSQIAIFFSPDQETSYPIIWPWDKVASGNPVSIWTNATTITLSIFSQAPLHGNWNGQTSSWTYWNSGFFRVFASS
ncbi:hypothetical protein [Burkholderia sp. BDU5]|uniref:hypothetical protein n=1 Tax=Burkholderia sp. BDU5 TaxID=1385590 RepID=UPI0009E93CF8|nr:hypothetical protein [Burkholderia sp. BDU5]